MSEIIGVNEDEGELEDKLEKYLLKYFHIERQVWSESENSRIDIVAVHRSDFLKEYPFGIEVKVDKKKKGHAIGEWLEQAKRYTKEKFKGYGKCIILTCPPLAWYYLREGVYMNQHKQGDHHDNVSTFLGYYGIGEVKKYIHETRTVFRGLRFTYNGAELWREHDDKLNKNMINKRWKKE